jgi:hypothetical protein
MYWSIVPRMSSAKTERRKKKERKPRSKAQDDKAEIYATKEKMMCITTMK